MGLMVEADALPANVAVFLVQGIGLDVAVGAELVTGSDWVARPPSLGVAVLDKGGRRCQTGVHPWG